MFLLLSASLLFAEPMPFEFQDGDRIVWIGATLVEREQRYGHWETALVAAHSNLNLTIRNLGWSGDTVYGDARAGFDDAKKGFERLVQLTLELKPTVIFVNYGSNEAFDGPAGLPRFEKGYAKLLDALSPAKARMVLFSPIPFEFDRKDQYKANVQSYAEVVKAAAQKGGHRFADLGKSINNRNQRQEVLPLVTFNGMHFKEEGYRSTEEEFLRSLDINLLGSTPDREKWFSADHEPLRKAIVAKNELFFHRWRPQNETYLFGFRKHEQGKNAKEIVEFDPLIADAEKKIRVLAAGLSK
ncbi:MAG: SGNH/GDSL hydrolase family protein [Gemmataceae bacterium]